MPDNNKEGSKKPYPMQVYLPIKTREAFDRKLLEEFEYAPSRSKMIRTWIEAYVGDRLKIVGGTKDG